MTDVDVLELRRRWFGWTGWSGAGGGPPLTTADRDQLQAWHDEQGHTSDPFNGCCFCCCEACDPR